MNASVGLAFVAALGAGCIVGPTSHWVPTGKVRRDKRLGPAHNYTVDNAAVDLDRHVLALRVHTTQIELCEHAVEVTEHTNLLGLTADLAIGAGVTAGGFHFANRCDGGDCKTAWGITGTVGLLYTLVVLRVWGAQNESYAWDQATPEACPELPAPPYDGDITVVLPEQKIRMTALGDGGTHLVEIPLHDAADAVFETQLGRLRATDLLPRIREVSSRLHPELETTLSLRDEDDNHVLDAGEHLTVHAVVRNRGTAAAWVQPRLATTGGHVAIEAAPTARRIAPDHTESFDLGLTAATDLADGTLAVDVQVDAAGATSPARVHQRIATARHRSPRPVLVGIEIVDGGPGTTRITNGNNDHAVERNEFVLLKLVFQNQGDAATRGELSVGLTSGDREVVVPTMVATIPAIKPGDVAGATFKLFVSPGFSRGSGADPRIPLTFSLTSSTEGSLAGGAVPLVLGEPPPPPRIKLRSDD